MNQAIPADRLFQSLTEVVIAGRFAARRAAGQLVPACLLGLWRRRIFVLRQPGFGGIEFALALSHDTIHHERCPRDDCGSVSGVYTLNHPSGCLSVGSYQYVVERSRWVQPNVSQAKLISADEGGSGTKFIAPTASKSKPPEPTVCQASSIGLP